MSKIVKAMDYGFRKTIEICFNPDDPKWVHADGSTHLDHTGNTDDDPGLTICTECRYNWDVREFVWTDSELKKNTAAKGEPPVMEAKTAADLTAEIKAALAPAPSAKPIKTLEGVPV